MKWKSNLKRLLSKLMVIAMVMLSFTNVMPMQATAAVDSKKLASTYLNATTVYLHLGHRANHTYNFNINDSAKAEGSTYYWYVKTDKGNSNAVIIDSRTGVVTAKEEGSAYIGCKVTLKNGTILRPEAKVVVRNNITKVDITNLPTDLKITAGQEWDFNRTVLYTEGGRGQRTSGITRWQITDESNIIDHVTSNGVVKTIKEGTFKIRAISFQSTAKYRLWLNDVVNETYITAASDWYTITVVAPVPTVTPTPTLTPTPTPAPVTGGGTPYIHTPVISNVTISSNSAKGANVARNGDIITLQFTSDEPITKLDDFRINGRTPDTFTNVGYVYKATHLVDSRDAINGNVVTFQIKVKNAAGTHSLTVTTTSDHSSVTIVDEKPVITDVKITSSNRNNTKAMIGDTITLTFKSDEPVTKLSNFKINSSNPDTFTHVGDVYTATHLVDQGDPVTGQPVTFQINVKNAMGIYSLTIEQTTDGSSVTIIEKMPNITNVSITSNSAKGTKFAGNGDIITLQFTADEPVTKLSNFKINGSNPDTFTHEGNVYTATHLVDSGDAITGAPATFQINVKNAAGIYSYTIENTSDGSSVTIVDEKPAISNVHISSSNTNPTRAIIGDTITLTFNTDEPVTKLSNFKINSSNPDTFTNDGNVYTATHLVDEGDLLTGLPVTFQINVKNTKGIYSLTIETTSDGSSVTVFDNQVSSFSGTIFASDFDRDLLNNQTLQGARITLTEAVPMLTEAVATLAANSVIYETLSDSEGNFIIKDIPLGTYILEVTMNGYVLYRNVHFTINISDNSMKIYLDAGEPTSTLTGLVTVADTDTIASNNLTLPNATVTLTKIGSSMEQMTILTNSAGKYEFTGLACGLYEIAVTNDGYIPIYSEIAIFSSGITTYNITLEAIKTSFEGNGMANGVIINALTGNGVEEGLTLTAFSGYNMTGGFQVASTTTDSDGRYSFNLPAGNYTVYVTDNRVDPTVKYNSGSFIIKVLGNAVIDNQNGQVTPILINGEIRIVLSWGATPEDLDSHLIGPTGEGTTYHIYYGDDAYYQGDALVANLDVDDTDSYGPETTTIYQQEEGIYKFSVFDFTNGWEDSSAYMANSGACVRVYIGGAVYTYYVPNLEGTLWDVFEYNSSTGKITALNRMSYGYPDEGTGAAMRATLSPVTKPIK